LSKIAIDQTIFLLIVNYTVYCYRFSRYLKDELKSMVIDCAFVQRHAEYYNPEGYGLFLTVVIPNHSNPNFA